MHALDLVIPQLGFAHVQAIMINVVSLYSNHPASVDVLFILCALCVVIVSWAL